ncbi:Beta-hexosaminidase [Tritrichomonas foetus]|uniref:beta-N-acetylhexosaminidase n=1 Tax=Tritrichomonas foetus TaxID=1144522 RepID=A0A1J4JD14_9EUKA|nr:Beta-hexosaminidase [Tritrichomonas foetus]|eukprot:OHS96159.1 Beta-hexosaminidase [Tritrichomonas foetus]
MIFCLLAFALSTEVNIVPRPNEVSVLEGQTWTLQAGMQIGYDASIEGAKDLAQFISDSLYTPTGIRLAITETQPKLGIYLGKDTTGSNEYHLSMDANLVTVLANTRQFLFYGFQTLLQLLPAKVYADSLQSGVEWTAQCVVVHDSPRFEWRGIMLDPCRHFFDVDVIKTIINGMSHFKFNILHFHMTEDQAWRLELEKFPNLTIYGAIRDASPKHWDGWVLDGIPYGPYFFTADDIKEILKYANDRSITVIPEIEMPGHALACLSGFPQYSCTGGPFKPRCYWGVEPDIFCAGNDDTIKFLESLIDEVIAMFPGTMLHLGGDECPRTRWETCPKCQQRMKDEGLKNTDELQTWFTRHFCNYLETKGRRLIGWDEILSGDLPFPESAIVMSWRGTAGGEKAVKLGHDVVMTPDGYCYYDYCQFAANDKFEYIGGLVTIRTTYFYNPTQGIDEENKHHIIGVQCNCWSEYTWEQEDLQYKIFPRSLAMASTGWCQHEDKDWARFVRDYAVKGHDQLVAMGLNEAGVQYGTQAYWSKGEFQADKWLSVTFPVDNALNSNGDKEAVFVHTSGSQLRIRNVKLLFNDAVVSEDNHEGVAAEVPTNNIYSFSTSETPGEKITISAEVKCEGGDDCEGRVFLFHK